LAPRAVLSGPQGAFNIAQTWVSASGGGAAAPIGSAGRHCGL